MCNESINQPNKKDLRCVNMVFLNWKKTIDNKEYSMKYVDSVDSKYVVKLTAKSCDNNEIQTHVVSLTENEVGKCFDHPDYANEYLTTIQDNSEFWECEISHNAKDPFDKITVAYVEQIGFKGYIFKRGLSGLYTTIPNYESIFVDDEICVGKEYIYNRYDYEHKKHIENTSCVKVIIPVHQNDRAGDMREYCERLFNRMRKSIEEWEKENCQEVLS